MPLALVQVRDPDGIPIEVIWTGAVMGSLPIRSGPRPRTSDDIPHRQLDQQPPDAGHLDALLAEASTWPGIVEGPSGISVEGASALSIDEAIEAGPDEAFLVGRGSPTVTPRATSACT